ncbi:MAG: hypothetical protein LBI03_11775 [Clostridiales bacterium]|jgi:hypothetical protein|nr:hypothetical protein [Clostridiales bacterium]
MKNKKMLIIPLSIIVLLSITVLCVYYFILKDKNNEFADAKYDPDSIISIKVDYSPTMGIDSFVLNKKEDIEFFMKCVKGLKDYRAHRLYNVDVEIIPYDYKIQYTFDNGNVKESEHIVYPASIENPLVEVFKLESVLKQINKIFLIDVSKISMMKIIYSDPYDISLVNENIIKDKSIISYMYNIAKKDVLINKNSETSSCSIGFYSEDESSRPIYGFYLTKNTYMLDKFCDRYPEIAEIVNIAKKRGFNEYP